jgi:hypothetical protein
VASGHVSIVQWLVSVCGVNPKLQTSSGNTTIDIARLAGHKTILQLFGENIESDGSSQSTLTEGQN